MALAKATVVTVFLLSLLIGLSKPSFIKSLLGSALMGDIVPAFIRTRCMGSGSNFTRFQLFSRTYPENSRPLVPGDRELLHKSEFDPSLDTKVIIHGFLDSPYISDWMDTMRRALLAEGDYNVLLVDWSCGNGLPYYQAVENSKITAARLGDLIQFMKGASGAEPSRFHLIGHSLGSQISAIVGHRIPHLGRISGLDPAGPSFYKASLEDRLDPSDASFVDVIHTDGGSGLFEGLGLHSQLGHVDFYPNGGNTQPGCHSSPFKVLQRVGLQRAARYYLTCDHYRAVEFYIGTIGQSKNSGACEYVGVHCRDWKTFSEGRCANCLDPKRCAPMGYYSNSYQYKNADEKTREFYVKTSENEPYCVHQYQVILETAGRNDTDVEEDLIGVNPGVMHLELKTQSGRSFRLSMNEKREDRLRPTKKYVYLTTSTFPMDSMKSASLWWGSENKPTSAAGISPTAYGFQLKRVQITPISLLKQKNLQSSDRSLQAPQAQHIVFCGSSERTVARNQVLELSADSC